MKTRYFFLGTLLAFLFFTVNSAVAQTDTTLNKVYVVETYDGGEFVGALVYQDDKEVTIETEDRGRVTIPKYQIKTMKELKGGEFSLGGKYIPESAFASRYFLTTNGIPIEKGDSYILWNLYGPEFQFGVAKNFSVGIMTTWLAVPIIGTAKYSIRLGENASLGIGTLLGTGSWTALSYGGVLPYGSLTFGDKRRNINLSGGYGAIFGNGNLEGRALLSVGGMTQVGKKVSLVFDSFILPRVEGGLAGGALLIPGLRFQGQPDRAFQFGFAGLVVNGNLIPFPIPVVQWFRKF